MSLKENHEVRFYSLPPETYPYLLVNRKNYRILFQRKFKHAIVDCGVMDFVKNNVKEYPKSFLDGWGWKAKELQNIWHEKVWFVIPDYPDDYNPGQFGDNVSKTLKNIERYLSEAPNVNWLPVIQSRHLNKFSFLESVNLTHSLIGDYPRVAIGTVCKTRNIDFMVYCCQTARKFFPKSWLHAFGLTLSALPKVQSYINSFDSMAWTFPRESGNPSCKNNRERLQYFNAYMKRLKQVLSELKRNESLAQA